MIHVTLSKKLLALLLSFVLLIGLCSCDSSTPSSPVAGASATSSIAIQSSAPHALAGVPFSTSSGIPLSIWAAGQWSSGTIYYNSHIIYNSGSTYNLSSTGTMTFNYQDGNTSRLPIEIPPNSSFTPAVYISHNRTAIAFLNSSGQFQVMYSNNEGNTWVNSQSLTPETYSYGGFTYSLEEYASAYIGFTSSDNGFLVFCSPVAAGSENHAIYTTSDGGKSWTLVRSDIDSIYARVCTGVNFINSNVGFMCFRTDFINVTVFRTADGGKTWGQLPFNMPSQYTNTPSYPLSPYFIGDKGVLPVDLYGMKQPDGNDLMISFVSNDGGKTWAYHS